MAKGRKLTTSRSERYLGGYSYGGGGGENGGDVSELGEDDVWSAADEVADRFDQVVVVSNNNNNSSMSDWSPRAGLENMSNGRSRRRAPSPSDDGGGGDRHVGGLSLAFDDLGKTVSSPRIVHQFRGNEYNNHSNSMAAAAAVASPRGHQMATSAPVNVPDWSKIYRVDSVESMHDSDDVLDDRDSEMIPPHEYLAHVHAQSRRGSVFEGVGRTLKGRDLRRVRDAVWSQTGFNG
ncbi:hypothetical protein Dsin_027931 [Dipteronia sinensis]|uniref:Senescence regulator n=1 Tax=Dipteronia sinensis TaxID=43782 RepID=A0AAD9ZPL6_9ROSI|nr:hypothetical protein Dsin_027931 [Dipteronia sinensis]